MAKETELVKHCKMLARQVPPLKALQEKMMQRTGKCKATINNWCYGRTIPDLESALIIKELTGIPINKLIPKNHDN